jgi:hypothetical protein
MYFQVTKQNLTNYYLELKQYFRVYGTMLDVGCSKLDYLFQFDDSRFSKLIGIDINLDDDPFRDYLDYKNSNPELKFEYDYLEKRFLNRYRLFKTDILEYNIKKDFYGFIFCKHIIHFIHHDKQFQLIDNLYSGLKANGLLFLKINHVLNKQYADSSKVNIEGNIFIEKIKGIIHYPCDSEEYIKHLTNKYKIEYVIKDEKSVTALIRK